MLVLLGGTTTSPLPESIFMARHISYFQIRLHHGSDVTTESAEAPAAEREATQFQRSALENTGNVLEIRGFR